jgi:hypothetical protein
MLLRLILLSFFQYLLGVSSGDVLWGLLDVDLSSLFIVDEPPHRVYLYPDSNSKR